jgi:hypothetical protein
VDVGPFVGWGVGVVVFVAVETGPTGDPSVGVGGLIMFKCALATVRQ